MLNESSNIHELKRRLLEHFGEDQFVGQSPNFVRVIECLPMTALADSITVVAGETGTGKESFARALHYFSGRAAKPFVPVNCGTIPEKLAENELFGHERGAFTDAREARRGLVREAEGGTLFLDEINSLPSPSQVKLLRFLEDRSYRPLGGSSGLTADVRVICATNARLRDEVKRGTFREDLYFRISALTVELPPLRERLGDIQLLAFHFLKQFAIKYNRQITRFAPAANVKLNAYHWPGNIRELKNVVERAVLFASSDEIHPEKIDFGVKSETENPGVHPLWEARNLTNRKFEREYVVELLRQNNWNVTRAAFSAHVSRRTIQRMINKNRITTATFDVAGATDLSHH